MKPDAKRDYAKLSKALEMQIKELQEKHEAMYKEHQNEMTVQEKKLLTARHEVSVMNVKLKEKEQEVLFAI